MQNIVLQRIREKRPVAINTYNQYEQYAKDVLWPLIRYPGPNAPFAGFVVGRMDAMDRTIILCDDFDNREFDIQKAIITVNTCLREEYKMLQEPGNKNDMKAIHANVFSLIGKDASLSVNTKIVARLAYACFELWHATLVLENRFDAIVAALAPPGREVLFNPYTGELNTRVYDPGRPATPPTPVDTGSVDDISQIDPSDTNSIQSDDTASDGGSSPPPSPPSSLYSPPADAPIAPSTAPAAPHRRVTFRDEIADLDEIVDLDDMGWDDTPLTNEALASIDALQNSIVGLSLDLRSSRNFRTAVRISEEIEEKKRKLSIIGKGVFDGFDPSKV